MWKESNNSNIGGLVEEWAYKDTRRRQFGWSCSGYLSRNTPTRDVRFYIWEGRGERKDKPGRLLYYRTWAFWSGKGGVATIFFSQYLCFPRMPVLFSLVLFLFWIKPQLFFLLSGHFIRFWDIHTPTSFLHFRSNVTSWTGSPAIVSGNVILSYFNSHFSLGVTLFPFEHTPVTGLEEAVRGRDLRPPPRWVWFNNRCAVTSANAPAHASQLSSGFKFPISPFSCSFSVPSLYTSFVLLFINTCCHTLLLYSLFRAPYFLVISSCLARLTAHKTRWFHLSSFMYLLSSFSYYVIVV